MNKIKVRNSLRNILEIIDSIKNGETTINKLNDDSDYLKRIYTPEVLLAHIEDFTNTALKGLDEYE